MAPSVPARKWRKTNALVPVAAIDRNHLPGADVGGRARSRFSEAWPLHQHVEHQIHQGGVRLLRDTERPKSGRFRTSAERRRTPFVAPVAIGIEHKASALGGSSFSQQLLRVLEARHPRQYPLEIRNSRRRSLHRQQHPGASQAIQRSVAARQLALSLSQGSPTVRLRCARVAGVVCNLRPQQQPIRFRAGLSEQVVDLLQGSCVAFAGALHTDQCQANDERSAEGPSARHGSREPPAPNRRASRQSVHGPAPGPASAAA